MRNREANFEITNKTKSESAAADADFLRIKNSALGKNYSLSLVFVGAREMKKLNRVHRKKNYPTDILSFGLGKNVGEIFICPSASRAKAKEFGRTYSNYLLFLFIHGCIHLKGFDHGVTMERQELALRKKFGI